MTENKRFKCVCMAEDLMEFQDNGIYKCFNDVDLEKLLNELHEENQELKYQNEMLSDELEQCKAVIHKKWSEYLKKKGMIE